MSKKEIYYCDRCKKELKSNFWSGNHRHNFIMAMREIDIFNTKAINIHLCENCYKDLKIFLKGEKI